MEEFKNEFEKHERLTEFISEMASTGRVPREWSIFIAVLNEALSQHDVIKNEVAVCKHVKVEVDDDGLGNTHYCSKCREWNF